jgi:beta-phosphoglucomutase-like phosphatase (HAD superfamily)/dTDP-glucose pyrophosphorylase
MNNYLSIFDLDGVLIESREMHYDALNQALANVDPKFVISKEEHLSSYDGLPTSSKLNLLTENKGLPIDKHQQIWEDKQKATIEIFSELENDYELMSYFKQLKNHNYRIAVASNSIRNTVKLVLLKLGLLEFIDYYVSNEDVIRNKPFPEMYWKCMSACNSIPRHTVIFEDSHIGRQGAIDSGAHLIPIENRFDLNQEKINKVFNIFENQCVTHIPWRSEKMNVLIPMAGAGSRFADAGYTFPKPLIEVNGKPMIQVVVENLNIEANYTFIVQKEHYLKYSLQYLLNLIAPNCNIVQVDQLTQGAACTTLLAKQFIDNDSPLLIANSDQFVEWNSNECLYAFNADGIDGGILTFRNCFGYRTLVETKEYGKIPIGKIVTQKLKCNVLSYNEELKIFEYTKVLDFIRLKGDKLDWKTLITPWGGKTKVTSDHEFLTVDGYKMISNISNNNDKILTNKLTMNSKQFEVFEGTMLGDSSIPLGRGVVNGGLKFSHCKIQKKWAQTKLDIFKNIGTYHCDYDVKLKSNDKTYNSNASRVKLIPEFKHQRKRWYVNGKKIVPLDIKLTPISIATWYMDDGHLMKKQNIARFSTDSYDDKSISILQNKLLEYNIFSYITTHNNYKRICISSKSSDVFFNLISSYIIPDMSYKVPEKYRNNCSYDEWNNVCEDIKYYENIKLEDVSSYTSDIKYAFCLETKNNNFIVDNLVAHNCHPKWSFAKIGNDGFVSEVAEKKPISDNASVGIYYWSKGSDYVKYAEQMISKGITTKNEYYVCPVFNEAIEDGKKIRMKEIQKMWGLGTPEDLNYFLEHYS